jgi:dolichol-phosphate mannosyltransferase
VPSTGPPPLTAVMPAYNEEAAIVLAVEDVRSFVLDRIPGAEFVVVNDGSRDRTGQLLDEIAATDPRIRVIHQRNAGHGGAVMTGLETARGTHVLLIDSDRQISLAGFGSAWALIASGRDGVFGVRRRRYDPALRVWLSRVIQFSIWALFSVRLADANVPYKLFRRTMWVDARRCIPPGTLAPSLFLAAYAKKRCIDIVEVDVTHRERDTGEVSIRRFKLLKFCATGFRQLLAFRRAVAHVG